MTGIEIAKTLSEWDCKDKHFYPSMFSHLKLIIGAHRRIMGNIFCAIIDKKTQIGALHVLAIAVKYGKVVIAQKILSLGGQVNK